MAGYGGFMWFDGPLFTEQTVFGTVGLLHIPIIAADFVPAISRNDRANVAATGAVIEKYYNTNNFLPKLVDQLFPKLGTIFCRAPEPAVWIPRSATSHIDALRIRLLCRVDLTKFVERTSLSPERHRYIV